MVVLPDPAGPIRRMITGALSRITAGAKETFLPTTEGEIGHRSSDANIDADISRRSFIAESAGSRAARSEERSLVSVRAPAKKFYGLIDGICAAHAQHGTEDLRVGELAGGRDAIENRGREEIPRFILRDLRVPSIENGLCAFANTSGDQRFDALLAFFRYHRPHLNAI